MNWFQEQWQMIMQQGILSVFFSFFTIVLIESILSVDNSSALSVLVKRKFPEYQRDKALTYGVFGAFFFRIVLLFFAQWLISNPTFGAVGKILGGLYLIRLFWTHLTPEADSIEEANTGWIDKITKWLGLTPFVQGVIALEFLDLTLSLDNIFACISMSKIMLVVILAVIVGITTMRFVTRLFTRLMVKYPKLEGSAFIVILLLGIKLVISGFSDYFPQLIGVKNLLENHWFDFGFSIVTLIIFLIPIFFHKKAEEVIVPTPVPVNPYIKPSYRPSQTALAQKIAGRVGEAIEEATEEIKKPLDVGTQALAKKKKRYYSSKKKKS